MLKSQIIILVIAIIAVIFLFNLPKYIVKDERREETTKTAAVNKASEEETHASQIPEADLKKLKDLTKNFLYVSDKEKKVKFADSLATTFRNFQKFDSSAKYLAEIAALKPEVSNFIKAGDAYFEAATYAIEDQKRQKLGEKAREQFNSALKKEPENLDVKAKIGKTYIGTEQTMMGIRQLKEVLEKDPQHEEALFALGTASIQTQQFDKAVERFEAMLKNNPDHLEANFWLGYSYLQLKKDKKAKEYFLKAKSLSQDPQVIATVDGYLKEIK